MKIIGNILLIVVILVASIYAGRNILIKNLINSGASNVLATNVNVDSVNFSPFDGIFQMTGISVANPDGFSAGNALYLGGINIKVEAKSMLTKSLNIEEIRITNPEINIVGKPGDTNLARLTKNVSSSSPRSSSTKNSSTEHAKHSEKECNVDVAIRYFTLQEGKVSASFVGLPEAAEVKLPVLELHNIGTDNKVNLHQAIQIIFKEIMQLSQKTALSGAGFSGQLENLKSEFQEKTKGLKEDISNKLKGLNIKGFGF